MSPRARALAKGSTWILLLASCRPVLGQERDPEVERILLAAEEARDVRADRGPLVGSVEAYPIRGVKSLYVAIIDYDDDPSWVWSSTFACFAVQDGSIDWFATCDSTLMEQAARSVRGFVHPAHDAPLIEVFGQTHMGNGNYYLFSLRDRCLELLASTYAVDRYWTDGTRLLGDVLTAQYTDHAVVLTGVAELVSPDDPERVLGSVDCRKVFLWEEGRLREDRSQRVVPRGWGWDD